MKVCRFQAADVVRLPLSNDDWIEVKARLSGGEARRMSSAAFKDMQRTEDPKAEPRIGVDFATLALARTKAYLKDWSFRDERDKPVKVTPESIEALTVDTLKEIEEALDKYLAAQDEETKAPSGEPASSQA